MSTEKESIEIYGTEGEVNCGEEFSLDEFAGEEETNVVAMTEPVLSLSDLLSPSGQGEVSKETKTIGSALNAVLGNIDYKQVVEDIQDVMSVMRNAPDSHTIGAIKYILTKNNLK